MEVIRTGLCCDFLKEISINAIVLRNGYIPYLIGIRIDAAEFDMAPFPIDDAKPVLTEDFHDIAARKIGRR